MGFFELLLIAVVTLLVVGPERMPEAVRTVALTIGRIKRSFNKAREEIEKQVGADDIRRQLHNEEIMESFNNVKSGLADINQQIDQESIDKPSAAGGSNQLKEETESFKGKQTDSSPSPPPVTHS